MKVFNRFYNVYFSSRIKSIAALSYARFPSSYSTFHKAIGTYARQSRIKSMEYVIYTRSDANK